MKLFRVTMTILAFISIAVLGAIGCSNSDVTASEGAEASVTDMVVEVNGKKLTQGEIQDQINAQIQTIEKQVPKEQMEQMKPRLEQMRTQMKDKLVDAFITKTVLSQEADKQKIVITSKDVDAKIKEFESQLPSNMTLENALKMSGTTMDKMREEILFGMKVEKLIDSQVKYDSNPDDKAIQEHYDKNKKKYEQKESVHARHILVKTSDKDDEKTKKEKRAKIDDIKKKLDGGADFETLAKEHSECPSKAKGGDLGTFGRGRMVKPFEEAAFSQKVNEIGPVVESRFGYHIIQVTEHNQPKQQQLSEVKDKIADTLKRNAKNEAVQKYIADLKSKAKIVYGDSSKKNG